jgi:energy-coupling factor transporter ATP-binding protein EcfA2
MQIEIIKSCPFYDSFRVAQVAGMFDVPVAQRLTQSWKLEISDLTSFDWKIGVIVGPSGSGKTTVARHLWPNEYVQKPNWPADRAVVDHFPTDLSIKDIVGVLTSVGFSSPPSWVKPYSVLSNGEQFRCDLALALIDTTKPVIVFDEFTSVVDRTVAKTGSAAVANAIRKGRIQRKFVAVTCHYDVLEWLEPDWVLDMATREFSRRRLRRPTIKLEIRCAKQHLWRMFSPHHYLTNNISTGSSCYVALWEEQPVCFVAVLYSYGSKNVNSFRANNRKIYRISRIVTLPDYQGIGIGSRVMDAIAEIYSKKPNSVMRISASHPSVLNHCQRSPFWKLVNVEKTGKLHTIKKFNKSASFGRSVVTFEYIPAEKRRGKHSV